MFRPKGYTTPILGVSILLVFIQSVLSKFVQTIIFKELKDSYATVRREYEYYERCMTDNEFRKNNRRRIWSLILLKLKDLF